MQLIPSDVIGYIDENGTHQYFRRKDGGFLRSTMTVDGHIGEWVPMSVYELPVEVIGQLFDCVTDQIKLTAYHTYKTLCRWKDLNASARHQYTTAAAKSMTDKPLEVLVESLERRGTPVWFVSPTIEIPHCTIGGAFDLTEPGCTLSVNADGDLSIMTGPIAHVQLGRGNNSRFYTYNPDLRAFKYKIAEKTNR